MAREDIVSLESFGGGGLQQLFEHELNKVLENIADQLTKATAKRTLTIKLTFTPMDDRKTINTAYSVTSSPAPIQPPNVILHSKKEGSKRVAVSFDPEQGALFPNQIEVREV